MAKRSIKTPLSRSMTMVPRDPNAITVQGATSPTGSRWVQAIQAERTAWTPLSDFTNMSRAIEALARQDVVVIGKRQREHLSHMVGDLSDFPTKPLIERSGWTGGHFALPDGYVFSPEGSPPATILFAPDVRKCSVAGTLAGWRQEVAEQLVGQHLAVFVVMAAFAAPLLDLTNRVGNFGFELVGPKGVGKSTLQKMMASVLGQPLDGPAGHYWITMDATANGLERSMADHRHLPMILEEASVYAAGHSGRARGDKYRELVFKLAGGHSKSRFDSHRQHSFRLIYVTSSNEALADVIGGGSSAVADAAADRLLTLPIAADRPFGVFDMLPEAYGDSSELATALTSGMAEHYGQAFRQFIADLVKRRAADEAWVRNKIDALLAKFRARVGVDSNDGSAGRVADAFGLVMVAGIFARNSGALPKSFNCGAAAEACYRLNRYAFEPAPSPVGRLMSFAERADIRQLSSEGLRGLSGSELISSPAFIRVKKTGERELLVTTPAFQKQFPDWRRLLRDREISLILISDNGRNTVKRQLGPDGVVRVYCFRLPAASQPPERAKEPAEVKQDVRKPRRRKKPEKQEKSIARQLMENCGYLDPDD